MVAAMFDFLSILGLGIGPVLGGLLGGKKQAQPDFGAARAAEDAANTARQDLEEQRAERDRAAAAMAEGEFSDAALRARDRKLRTAGTGFGDYSPVGAVAPSSVAYKVAFGD